MINTIKCTVLSLIRTPGVLIWSLVFPLILMTVFSLMFGPLDERSDLDPLPVVIAQSEEATEDSAPNQRLDQESFDTFIESLSTGDDRLLDVTYKTTAKDAEKAVRDAASEEDGFIGYVQLVEGVPQVHVVESTSTSDMSKTYASILVMIMDEYTAQAAQLKKMMQDDPTVLASPAILASVQERIDATQKVDVTTNQPKESVRYYFALLGMAALFGGNVSLIAFQRMTPNVSALGARRMIGALSHAKAVAATLVGCWIINFSCLTISYAFLRFVAGVDFAGRDAACIAVIAMSSLMAIALGCAMSAIPKIPEEGKAGLLTGIVCFSSLFAGLYGEPTMALADTIAAACPIVPWVNPASQISQAFYSVMYYDTFTPLLLHLAALAIMTGVLFVLSVSSLRRVRYASL